MSQHASNKQPSRWPEQPEELWRLLGLTCSNQAQPEEIARLEAILQSDSRAQELYLTYLDIHAQLQWRYREEAQSAPSASQASAAELPLALSPTRPSALPPDRTPVLGFLGRIRRQVPGGEVTVGGLVVLVVFAAFWSLSQAIMYPNLGSQDLASSTDSPTRPLAHSPARTQPVATILDSDDVQWSGRREASLPPAIRRGEALSIASGLVELKLTQGTKLLIEGPAEWSIDGQNNATLKRGKLVASVPKQAIGFTLETPTAKIVDLGTEFEVDVAASGKSQVHVRRGAIEATPLDSLGSAATVRLSAGEGVYLDGSTAAPQKYSVMLDPSDRPAFARPAVVGTPLSKLDLYDGFSGTVILHLMPIPCDGVASEIRFFSERTGRGVTPLLFHRDQQTNLFRVSGIGRTVLSTAAGQQAYPFELVAGSDRVVNRQHYFGLFFGVVRGGEGDREEFVEAHEGAIPYAHNPKFPGPWLFRHDPTDTGKQLGLGSAYSAAGKPVENALPLVGLGDEHPGRFYAAQLVVERKRNSEAKGLPP